MLGLVLMAAATGNVVGEKPTGFDLATIVATSAAPDEDRARARRYLLPDIEEPVEDSDGVEVKLRWRKVRVTVPIAGLQPPF